MLNNDLLKKIRTEAVRLDWEVAFGGKANGNKHLFRVNKIIKFLVKKEGGDKKIAEAGGWVHDVSLAWGSDYDEKHVEKYTLKFLRKYKSLDVSEVQKIAACAISHESGNKKISIEAQIVHDADVVDKSGTLGIIRHIWKMTNMIENRVLNNELDLINLKKHLRKREKRIFTNTAKKLTKKLNKHAGLFFDKTKSAMDIMSFTSRMAMDGKTSDQIANLLIKSQKNEIFRNLKDQLDCRYLT